MDLSAQGELQNNKVAGAQVVVGVRGVVVAVEVEEAIIIVRVIVATDIERTVAGVRVDIVSSEGPHCAGNPGPG